MCDVRILVQIQSDSVTVGSFALCIAYIFTALVFIRFTNDLYPTLCSSFWMARNITSFSIRLSSRIYVGPYKSKRKTNQLIKNSLTLQWPEENLPVCVYKLRWNRFTYKWTGLRWIKRNNIGHWNFIQMNVYLWSEIYYYIMSPSAI